MKKLLSILLLCFCTITIAQEKVLVAPIFPASIPFGGNDNMGIFLTNSSYDQVKAFYANSHGGNPKEETITENTGKRCYFEYIYIDRVKYIEQSGVVIENKTMENRAIKAIMDKYETALLHQSISKSEYENIFTKYGHLKHCYFPLEYDNSSKRYKCKSAILYDKYADIEKKKSEALDNSMEKAQERMMQLIAEGKYQEASAIMQGTTEGVLEEKQSMSIWEDCLKELAQNAFQTKINIGFK